MTYMKYLKYVLFFNNPKRVLEIRVPHEYQARLILGTALVSPTGGVQPRGQTSASICR